MLQNDIHCAAPVVNIAEQFIHNRSGNRIISEQFSEFVNTLFKKLFLAF